MRRVEKHDAVVADTDDPKQRFRIKVKCAAILGSEDAVVNLWVEPKLPWGFVIVPDVGEQVEIEVTASSDTDEVPGQAFLEEPDLRWSGKKYQGPEAYNTFFTEANYGRRRGFATPGGHVIMFDDTDDARKINLAWHSGDNTFSMFSMDEDGSIIIANVSGSLLYLNAVNKQLAIIDEWGNSITLHEDGIKLITKDSNIIESKGTNIQVLAQDGCTISCKDVVLDAGKVQIGGQPLTEPAVLGALFVALFSGHTHSGVMTGPEVSGVPVPGVPIPVATVLSTTAFIKP